MKNDGDDAATRVMPVARLMAAETVQVPVSRLVAAASERAAPAATANVRRASTPAATKILRRVRARTAPSGAPTTVVPRLIDARGTRPSATPRTRRARWLGFARRTRRPAVTIAALVIATCAAAFVASRAPVPRMPSSKPARVELVSAAPMHADTTAQRPPDTDSRALAPPPMPAQDAHAAPAGAAGAAAQAPATASAERPTLAALAAEAVDALARGDHARALAHYRALARRAPERAGFAIVVEVLERKARARCAADRATGGVACSP